VLLCGLQLFTTTRAAFSFTINLFSHTTSVDCGFLDGDCETFLSAFCLRGPRSSQSADDNDCPLGRNGEAVDGPSGIRTITSSQPWPVKLIQCTLCKGWSGLGGNPYSCVVSQVTPLTPQHRIYARTMHVRVVPGVIITESFVQ
jgi:hypothetical protein